MKVFSLLMRVSFLLCASPLFADPLSENSSAEEIVRAATAEGALGFSSGQATIEMIVTKKNGKQKQRTLKVVGKQLGDGEGRTLMRFVAPADISGSSFLVVRHKDRLGEQYIYLPAIGSTQQIAASKASKSFFGSDLSYADLMPLKKEESGRASFVRLDDGQIGGQETYHVEVRPNIPGAPYKKLLIAIHKKHLVPLEIQYFDKKEAPLKTLMVKKLKKIGERYLPVKLSIQHLKRGSKTELNLVELDPNALVSDDDVSKSALVL